MLADKQKLKLHFQRFEFKYVFPKRLVEGILPELLRHMEFDPFASEQPDNSYIVSSLYFDSAGYGSYYEKINGVRNRKKLRLRYYGDRLEKADSIFLEIKRKFDAVVIKDRLKLTQAESRSLLEDGNKMSLPDGHDKDTLEEFLWTKISNSMMPQILLVYKRRPLFSKIDASFRLTIDYDIFARRAYGIDNFGEAKPVYTDLAVLEVKFNNLLPLWFQNIIQSFSLTTQPFSKYCLGLEKNTPGLNDENQWLLNQPNVKQFFSI